MNKKVLNNFVAVAMFLIIALPVFAFVLPAQAQPNLWGEPGSGIIEQETGLGNRDPREIIARVINIVLGFLGVIAVAIIMFGGFKWMTAAGNEDKVTEAKKLIQAGIIGLIIILASFGLASFIVDAALNATS